MPFNLLVSDEKCEKVAPGTFNCAETKTESCREEQVTGFLSEYCTVASGYCNLLILFYCFVVFLHGCGHLTQTTNSTNSEIRLFLAHTIVFNHDVWDKTHKAAYITVSDDSLVSGNPI